MKTGLIFMLTMTISAAFPQLYPYNSSSGGNYTFPSEMWHEGKLILESGDTLRGNIKYDLQNDILQYEWSGKLETFSARKVLFFEIFDKTVKRYRPFYSLPYATPGGYKATVFFELLSEGKITLLCRESLETRSMTNSYYGYGYGSSTRIVLVNKFFLLNERGIIEPFSGRKSDLVDLMGRQSEEVEKFIKSNKLKVDQKYDLAQVVNYYNSLFK
ncbi:MAG TPA: hypothetical protein PLR06_11750 [Cyclobacteriaceae bacterium]|nr:hypothetical protein [Cyclobacteriaceae bacterium]